MKKLPILCIAVLLCLSVFVSCGKHDTPDENPTEGLEYTLSDDGKYYIVSGIGDATDTDIVIPSSYNDLPVKTIGRNAFYECQTLTSVKIPGGVNNIDDSAFSRCSALLSVKISDGVTEIDPVAFFECSSLTTVEIPKSVTFIGGAAFANCSALTSIYYGGTEEEWNAIRKAKTWSTQAGEYTIFFADSKN